MATTTTTAASAITVSGTQVQLTAYTAPSGRAKPLLRCEDEIMLIVDATNSPTLQVVRGYMGTSAVAHTIYAGIVYGKPEDMQASKGPTQSFPSFSNPKEAYNTMNVTATGATGSTAAPINTPFPVLITATGASGAGINLPVPLGGEEALIKNMMTGAVVIYSVGATVNGVSGATGTNLTVTGNSAAMLFSTVAGAWQMVFNT